MARPSILAEPFVSMGAEITGDLASALRRQWLVTNGLGGFASGTLAGLPTRRYHGLLVAATEPPGGRRVLVGGLIEWATVRGQRFGLHAFEYADGTIDQHGYRLLASFELDGLLPVWRFEVAGTILERRVWMAHGANRTFVRWTVVSGDALDLDVQPLLTDRAFHELASADTFDPQVTVDGDVATVLMRIGDSPIEVTSAGGVFQPGGTWYRGVRHREEAVRGLDSLADLWSPGTVHVHLEVGMSWTLVLAATAMGGAAGDPDAALRETRDRQVHLLDVAGAADAASPLQQLILAADQFLVQRGVDGETVIAGYPWFGDWGRDTMIALPGLTLATGRPTEGAAILRTFAGLIRDGLLPNDLPELGTAATGYNTVDGALWFIHALQAHVDATGDRELLRDLLPAALDIVDHYAVGTRFGIALDPADGLLRAGQPGQQLTWMDARVGDREITPRIGKPVEINALWLNALHAVCGWLEPGDATAERLTAMLELGRRAFAPRFWLPDQGWLADVIDGPTGTDATLRPNQILALALPLDLISAEQAASILAAIRAWLLTPLGLRTLDPRDPRFAGIYAGGPAERDGSYHQGPVWTWLIGPYADAVARYGSRGDAAAVLEPFRHHLADAGLGSVSELLDGDPPHQPRGAFAQAWGVAEVLRAWRAYRRPAAGDA